MVGTIMDGTCSHQECISPRSHYFIDGQPFCRHHGFGDDIKCSGTFANGKQCPYKARTYVDGAYMCLRHGSANTCSICLEECGASGCTTTPCAHRFHEQCLLKWREREGGHKCPMCRATIGDSKIHSLMFQYAWETGTPEDFMDLVVQRLSHQQIQEFLMAV